MTDIPYFDGLMGEEQREITDSIRLLLRQTFILERKYDRRTDGSSITGNSVSAINTWSLYALIFPSAAYRFMRISQLGVIYIQGETLVGDKLPRLATLYLLILKLIYDEQMESVSTSVNVYTTLGEIHEKLGSYRLFKKQPSPTDIRRAVTLLKKYQVIEPLELLDDLNGNSRLIVYPCINVVLLGDDVRELLESFREDEALQAGTPQREINSALEPEIEEDDDDTTDED